MTKLKMLIVTRGHSIPWSPLSSDRWGLCLPEGGDKLDWLGTLVLCLSPSLFELLLVDDDWITSGEADAWSPLEGSVLFVSAATCGWVFPTSDGCWGVGWLWLLTMPNCPWPGIMKFGCRGIKGGCIGPIGGFITLKGCGGTGGGTWLFPGAAAGGGGDDSDVLDGFFSSFCQNAITGYS